MDNTKAKVLVCQHGARHRYAVPRMLESENMLAGLYTDSSAHSWMGMCAKIAGRRASASLQRLSKRIITGVPKEKIYSFDYPAMRGIFHRLKTGESSGLQAVKRYGDWMSERMIQQGVMGADIVYSMNRSNLTFVEYARSQGCKSIIDIFISPATDRVMQQEIALFPGWGAGEVDLEWEMGERLWKKTAAMGDILLCPSEWVAEGLREIAPEHGDKIRIVPYGCSIEYGGRVNSPIQGRVLFAGGDALRKGLHYLAQAASRLQQELPELDVRIAGNLPSEVTNHPAAKDLNFLGKLNLEQMKQEYLSADVFVLPSLSEGFAGVVAEAIAAGCPVIVTLEAGSPVVDEREGLVVPSRDVEALSEAIRRLITDRALRSRCSEKCTEQIAFYSEKKWKERLLDAINSLG